MTTTTGLTVTKPATLQPELAVNKRLDRTSHVSSYLLGFGVLFVVAVLFACLLWADN
jgi:hypothetical protein